MLAIFAALMLLGPPGDPPPTPAQLRDLIRIKTAPMKSLAFAYECQYRLLDKVERNKDGASTYDEDIQGLFLYRSDGAALNDFHRAYLARNVRVSREKVSLLRETIEQTPELLDAQEQPPKDDIRSRRGSLIDMNPTESPTNLCAIWGLEGLCDNLFHDLAVEGWEVLDGRDCLRVRISIFSGPADNDKERSKRIFWIDPGRNAQVVRMEWFQRGQLVQVLDSFLLAEHRLADGSSYWLPVQCHQRIWRQGESDPVTERFFAIVAGTERFNPVLPDALFDVRRESIYPVPKELASGTLAHRFLTQGPAPPKVPARPLPADARPPDAPARPAPAGVR